MTYVHACLLKRIPPFITEIYLFWIIAAEIFFYSNPKNEECIWQVSDTLDFTIYFYFTGTCGLILVNEIDIIVFKFRGCK